MIEDNIVGNEQALSEEAVGTDNTESQNTSSENKVNPAGIRKAQTQGILNALSKASGQNLSSVEDAVAYIARSTAQSQLGGSVKPVEQNQTQQQTRSVSNNDLQEQFQSLQKQLSQKETALKSKELESDILQSMGDRFDSELSEYAMQKVKSNIQWNEDNTYSIINAKGNPKLLKQTSATQSGSGLRPGQTRFAGSDLDAIPDFSRQPAEWKAWKQKNGLGIGVGLKSASVSISDSSPKRN